MKAYKERFNKDYMTKEEYDAIEPTDDKRCNQHIDDIIEQLKAADKNLKESDDYIDVYVVYNNDGPYETFDDEEDAIEAKKEYEEERPEYKWWINKEKKSTL